MRFASETLKGTFIRRLNRFLVECLLEDRLIRAHLPNPGRLWELLLPGRIVYLARSGTAGRRNTAYTIYAVERNNAPVFLHTHMTNRVVEYLIRQKKMPGYENARIVQPEYPTGRSRYDFLLEKDGRPFLLEVKSCTQFGQRIAMFPDAVTDRGRRHITELAAHARNGVACGVIFLSHCSHAEYFLPDYHTDYAFARTFLDARKDLLIKAISVDWKKDLSLGARVGELVIPWNLLEREAKDSGSYLLILHLPEDRLITMGGQGEIFFRRGFYIYAGSARKNLTRRIERHLRRRKNFFWHIDYLRDQAGHIMAIPIRSSENLEHVLTDELRRVSSWFIPGFGSSDCACETHLFGMDENPIHSPKFIALLQYFRIDRLEKKLGKERC
jgi:sugar fermentation stimulation protein A